MRDSSRSPLPATSKRSPGCTALWAAPLGCYGNPPAAASPRPSCAVLGGLLRDGPRQLTELAAAERINPTLLSRVVGRLEDEGLVKRTASEQDRRAYLVSITDQGKQLAEGIRHERCRALADHLAELDPAQAASLFAAVPALEALASALSAGRRSRKG